MELTPGTRLYALPGASIWRNAALSNRVLACRGGEFLGLFRRWLRPGVVELDYAVPRYVQVKETTRHAAGTPAPPTPTLGSLTPSQQAYIDRYGPYALEAERVGRVPALVVLAQSIQESGWGTAKPGNMMLGIKAYGPLTPYWPDRNQRQQLRTFEVINGQTVQIMDWFRRYPSPRESFLDYSHFLRTNSRYSGVWQFSGRPYDFIDAVARAGYATDPNYATAVKAIMRRIEPALDALKKKPATDAGTGV